MLGARSLTELAKHYLSFALCVILRRFKRICFVDRNLKSVGAKPDFHVPCLIPVRQHIYFFVFISICTFFLQKQCKRIPSEFISLLTKFKC